MSGKADVSPRNPAMREMMTRVEAAHAARIWPEINLWTGDAQRFAHGVDIPGLTVHALKGVPDYAAFSADHGRVQIGNIGVFAKG